MSSEKREIIWMIHTRKGFILKHNYSIGEINATQYRRLYRMKNITFKLSKLR